MTIEYAFITTVPQETKDFMKHEFREDHYNKTGIETDKFALQVTKNDTIIAVAKGAIFDKDLFISEFIVAKTYRKNGIGKELIIRINEYAKQKDCKNIWVDTMEYQAPEFYLKNGFIEKGRIENYRGKHARIFFKKKF